MMKTIIDKHSAGKPLHYLNAELDEKKGIVKIKLDYFMERYEGILKRVEE